MKGNTGSFRDLFITSFLWLIPFVEPLNLFFYSWRFIKELKYHTTSSALKKFYTGLEIISMVLLPAAFYTLVPYWAYLNAKVTYF